MYSDREMHCDALMYHSRRKFLKSRDCGTTRNRGGAVERGRLRAEPCKLETVLPPIELMTRPQSFRYAWYKSHQDNINTQVRCLPSFSKKTDPAVAEKHEEIFARIRAADEAIDGTKSEMDVAKQRLSEKATDLRSGRDMGQVTKDQATREAPRVLPGAKLEIIQPTPSKALPTVRSQKETSGSLPLLHTTPHVTKRRGGR